MSFGGGHVLSPLRLVVIAAANDPMRDSLFAAAMALPSSQWWRAVSAPFSISTTATAFTVTGPPIASGTTLAFTDVTAYVQHAAIDSAGYHTDGKTLYLIYLPPGVGCTGSSCAIYSAFHVPFESTDGLAIVKRSTTSTIASMTTVASHEITEAATDPIYDGWRLVGNFYPWNANPWATDDGGSFEENGDFCSGTRYIEGGFYYQRVYTNQAVSRGSDPCVPSIPVPYYLATTAKDWYSTTAAAVDVPITGWSDGAVADWVVTVGAGPHTSSLAAAGVSLSCADSVTIAGTRYCAFNRGRTATVHVTLPGPGLSKAYFTARVFSFRVGPNGERPPAGEDPVHRWIFGVYVP
jgi:hypothetical protein